MLLWTRGYRRPPLRSRLEVLIRWLSPSRLFWLWLSVLLVAWYAPLPFSSDLGTRIRYAGLILQLAGIGAVAYGIKKTRDQFRKPSWEQSLVNGLRDLPAVFRTRRNYLKSGAPQAGSSRVSAEGSAKPVRTKGASPRVAALEAELLAVSERVMQTQRQLDEEARVRDNDDKWERAARGEADARLWKALEEFSVGGLDLSAVGLWWLLVGLVLTTVAGEAVRFLARVAPVGL
jgi:hypothetical protein